MTQQSYSNVQNKNLCMNVYINIIHNHHKLEMDEISFNRWMY